MMTRDLQIMYGRQLIRKILSSEPETNRVKRAAQHGLPLVPSRAETTGPETRAATTHLPSEYHPNNHK